MAAADVLAFNPLAIAGLGKPLEKADMTVSQVLYNNLPDIRVQPRLQDEHAEHVKVLLAIIKSYSMGDHIGIHAAHRHDSIPPGTVRFEADMGINGFTWTKPTAIETPDASKMHATFFKVDQGSLVPFEFAEGPSPVDVTKIPAGFLPEFAGYLAKHDLTNVIAMQVGDFAKRDGADPKSTAEVEINWGQDLRFTVVVPTSILKAGTEKLIPTGWNVPAAGDPEGEPPAGEHWNPVTTPKNTHKVHVDGIQPLTPDTLIKALVEQEVVVA